VSEQRAHTYNIMPGDEIVVTTDRYNEIVILSRDNVPSFRATFRRWTLRGLLKRRKELEYTVKQLRWQVEQLTNELEDERIATKMVRPYVKDEAIERSFDAYR
jgi:hypothetical protein